jgi:hypothetical protein
MSVTLKIDEAALTIAAIVGDQINVGDRGLAIAALLLAQNVKGADDPETARIADACATFALADESDLLVPDERGAAPGSDLYVAPLRSLETPAALPEAPESNLSAVELVSIRGIINTLRDPAYGIVGAQRIKEQVLRAHYAIAAFNRVISAAEKLGALRRERRFHAQHLQASANRLRAATLVANGAREYGPILGWRALLDKGTTAECRAAHGKNFDVRRPPAIGWPGAVHNKCRCSFGRPVEHAPMLAAA